MVIGEICFISGLHCQKEHDIYWELHDSVEGTRKERGKGENLAIFTDFSIKGEICLKRKGGGVSSWLVVKQCKKKVIKLLK